MQNGEISSGNGACDSDGFNWEAGGQEEKYASPAELPDANDSTAGKYVEQADELEDIKPVSRLGSIDVRKPKKQEWFQSHAKMFVTVSVIKKESTGDFYLVDRALATSLSDEVRQAYLSAAVNSEGGLFLWPILKPKGDGAGSQLYENDLADLSLSRSTWIRRQWMPGQKAYKVDEAASNKKIPEWPDNQNIADWIDKAFKGKFIDDSNHPLLRQLRGEL